MVCLQETHGRHADFVVAFPHIANKWKIFSSPGPTEATGGVAILIKRSLFPKGAVFERETLVPGRVMRVQASVGGFSAVWWCVHNFGFSVDDARRVSRRLAPDAAWA